MPGVGARAPTVCDDDGGGLAGGGAATRILTAEHDAVLARVEWRRVADGQAWLGPRIVPEVLDVYRRRAGDDREVRAALGELTPREHDVLVLVGRGATNAEIAGELYIGEATVESHLGRVLAKLGLRDRAAAIVLAHRQGLP